MTDKDLKKAQNWRNVAIGIYYICMGIYAISTTTILYNMFKFPRHELIPFNVFDEILFYGFCILGCLLLTLVMVKIYHEEKKNEEDFECYMDRVIDYHMNSQRRG